MSTKKAISILKDFKNRGIKLWADGESLKYRSTEGAVTKEDIAGLKEHKTELMALLNQIYLSSNQEFLNVKPAEINDYYPVSDAQKRFYLLQLQEKDNIAYNIPISLKVEGKLDIHKVESVINQLIQRHEALRTSFCWINGELVQKINEPSFLKLKSLNYKINDFYKFYNAFDLENSPLIDAGYVSYSDSEHYLLINIHHIISDGISNNILNDEFTRLYNGEILQSLDIHYKDYCIWQNNLLNAGYLKNQEKYWDSILEGYKQKSDFPLDIKPKPGIKTPGKKQLFFVNKELRFNLERLANSLSITMSSLLFSMFAFMIGKFSNQDDQVIGVTVSGRNNRKLLNVIGAFVNFLPVRVRFKNTTFKEFAKETHNALLLAYRNQDFPFDKIVENHIDKIRPGENPLFNTMFNFHNENIMSSEVKIKDVVFSLHTVNLESTTLDVKLDVYEQSGDKLECIFEYNSSVLKEETMILLEETYIKLANQLVENHEKKLASYELFPDIRKQRNIEIVLSSTFVADSSAKYIEWWGDNNNVPFSVVIAPYNQVFQQLLDTESVFNKNMGVNILFIRFEDFIKLDNSNNIQLMNKLEKYFNDVLQAIKYNASKAKVFAGLFPVLHQEIPDEQLFNFISDINSRWEEELTKIKNIEIIDFRETSKQYGISDVYDPLKDQTGHIPYTDEYIAAIGTVTARRLYAWCGTKFKVIVLDCDNTLWKGVCGEDSINNLVINPYFSELQKFMLDKSKKGMLLALASKNSIADVWNVFNNHPDMILKPGHFAGYRINWEPKSQNIKELANELNLGLDSFIFVDDNPIECSKMMNDCPEVLTLCIPEEPQNIPAFLNHVWAFDKYDITEEDEMRTSMYLADKNRKSAQAAKDVPLKKFLDELLLNVSFFRITENQIKRVSQLSQRTNQFNSTTIRRSETDIENLMKSKDHMVWAVEANDKFGDYGIVGSVLSRIENSCLVVDSFMLSCRILGRNVEDAIVWGLKKYCFENKLEFLKIDFVPSKRNSVFLDFLKRLDMDLNDDVYTCTIPDSLDQIDNIKHINIHYLERLKKDKEVHKDVKNVTVNNNSLGISPGVSDIKEYTWNVLIENEDKLLHKHILTPLKYPTGKKLLSLPIYNELQKLEKAVYEAPETNAEKKLVLIFQELLKIEKIGVTDDFFNLGGNSLIATSLVSRIFNEFNISISITDFFNNSTIRQLACIIENMDINVDENQVIKNIPKDTVYPLSNSQRRLWILDKIDERSIVYNIPVVFLLEGKVDKDALCNAFLFVIDRHESLRTVFVTEKGNPYQKVLDNPDYAAELIDFRGYAYPEKSAYKYIKDDICAAFDLNKGPLIKFNLVQFDVDKYYLYCNMHHIISDGWSMNIFTRDFLNAYSSLRNNESPAISALKIQYKDYSAWQTSRLYSKKMESQKEYWLNKLSGEIPVLNLASDKTRPVVQTFNGKTINFTLSEELSISVNELCRTRKVSLFIFLHAVLKTLLYRYTGDEDIILGSPAAGRVHKDLEDQIGLYLNTLAFRDSINGNMKFIDFLKSVKLTCTEAFDNQDYPFDILVEDLDLRRDLSRSPVFDVMLIVQNNENTVIDVYDLKISNYPVEHGTSKFDITFEFYETEKGLSCNIEFNTDIYHEDTIERITSHFRTLLSSIVTNIDSRISDLEMIPEEERNILLNVFNNTKMEYSEYKTICDLFEEQVLRTPDAIALFFKDVKLTYKELNEKANRVCNYLRHNYNIKPGDLIGVLLGRSENLLITLLGILKSGAAYVPLDPDYPSDRIMYMLEDSSPVTVISENSEFSRLNTNFELITDILNTDFSIENSIRNCDSSNLAYVIYTSGSTGKPKGTMLSHRSVHNFINGITDIIDFSTGKIIICVTTVSFDIFVLETFVSLSKGLTVVLACKEEQNDPAALYKVINKYGVEMIQTTPSRIKMLCSNTHGLNALHGLSEIMIGGESFPYDLLLLLNKNCKGKIYNMYGPTETTVWSCVKELTGHTSIDIGSPIANTKIYMLSKDRSLCPIGVPGELCISGDGVSRGYLNRPVLTKEKFIDNPFSAGELLYCTGDAARWLSDGNIEYLERVDNQVKIRGYRIEPGEIENALNIHESIDSNVVIVKEISENRKEIFAYIVIKDDVNVSDLRSFLLNTLPDYMIPSYFIVVDSIPLTPNGKINRKALLSLDTEGLSMNDEYVCPGNDIEIKLVELWEDILGIEKIGVTDDFFNLGGNSLIATSLVSRIFNEFNISLSITDFFNNSTIRQLACIIENMDINVELFKIEKAPVLDTYDVLDQQVDEWILFNLKNNLTLHNGQLYDSFENFDIEIFEITIKEIVKKYELLRTVFILEKGRVKQKILKFNEVHYTINFNGKINNDEIEVFLKKDKYQRFDIVNGPLFRINIFDLTDKKNFIVITLSHMLFDTKALQILSEDLIEIYSAYKENRTRQLKPLTYQFKDYVYSLNKLLNSEQGLNYYNYWNSKIGGNKPVLTLAEKKYFDNYQRIRDKAKDEVLLKINKPGLKLNTSLLYVITQYPEWEGGVYLKIFNNEIMKKLSEIAKTTKTNLFSVITTIFKLLIAYITKQNDIIIAYPDTLRKSKEVNDIFGWLSAGVIVRTKINKNDTFVDYLSRVNQVIIEASGYCEYSIQRLHHTLNTSLSYHIPVHINYQTFDMNMPASDSIIQVGEHELHELNCKISKYNDGIVIDIRFKKVLFSEERVKYIFKIFDQIIQNILKMPDSMINEILDVIK